MGVLSRVVEASDATVEVALESGERLSVARTTLRLRCALWRVLAPTGGFQRGVLREMRADGTCCVHLAGGGVRWAGVAELARVLGGGKAEEGELVGVAPQREAAPRWLSAAIVQRVEDGEEGEGEEGEERQREIKEGVVETAGVVDEGESGAQEGERRVDDGGVEASGVAANAMRCERASRGPTVVLRRARGQKLFIAHMHSRRAGLFGLALDTQNRVMQVHKGSVAEERDIQPGDRVLRVDGAPFTGLLKDALAGKESAVLLCDVADEPPGEGEECRLPSHRLVYSLLSMCAPPDGGVILGDTVFALTGGWREATVERQEGGRLKLQLGGGEWRWASRGEVASLDGSPKPYDMAPGKAMLSWDEAERAFQPVKVLRREGRAWWVRFDCGREQHVALHNLRERWPLPVRVLGHCGDYLPAHVLESMGGLLRVDFSGVAQWILPEEVLSDRPPTAEELHDAPFVAVRRQEDDAAYTRATLTAAPNGGWLLLATEENGEACTVPLHAARLPLAPTDVVPVGSRVHALCGEWRAGVAHGLAELDSAAGRFSARVSDGARWWTTHLSPREMIARDQGDVSAIAQMKRGSPVVVRREDSQWMCALFVACTEGTQVKILLADGKELLVDVRQVRPRLGASHPVDHAVAEAARRAARVSELMALRIESAWRALAARRRARRREVQLVRAQSLFRMHAWRRVWLAQRRAAVALQAAARRRRARRAAAAARLQAAAAARLQAAARGGAARRAAEAARRAVAAEMARGARRAAVTLQAAARRRLARRAATRATRGAVLLQAAARRRQAAARRRQAAAAAVAAREAAAARVQAAWRGAVARRRRQAAAAAAAVAAAREAAAARVQAAWRGAVARRRREAAAAAAAAAAAREAAAARVQAAWRGAVARRRRAAVLAAREAAREASAARVQRCARRRAAAREAQQRRRAAAEAKARAERAAAERRAAQKQADAALLELFARSPAVRPQGALEIYKAADGGVATRRRRLQGLALPSLGGGGGGGVTAMGRRVGDGPRAS
ncbi:hypothetical protein AB1Y20_002694 [Prymnesium parvum]|uniref:PDZ domain-containing protein n=1 Tax=Prymnesium parvum TaxID=97485 RepID=A0AB34J9A2_PRYPA